MSDYGIVAYVGQGVQHSASRLGGMVMDYVNKPKTEDDRRRRDARNT